MPDSISRDDVDEMLAWGQALRRRLGSMAASIALTEDQIADTLENLADSHPHDAGRLLARAAQARSYAGLERDRAVAYGYVDDPSEPGSQAG